MSLLFNDVGNPPLADLYTFAGGQQPQEPSGVSSVASPSSSNLLIFLVIGVMIVYFMGGFK